MSGNLATEDIKLIADLIAINNEDIKFHFGTQIKALQEVNEVNHNSLYNELRELKSKSSATLIQATATNGRVNKIEAEIYGECNPKNKKQMKGKEGIIFYLDEVKKLRFTYKTWRHIVITGAIICAIFIKESRDFIFDKILNLKL